MSELVDAHAVAARFGVKVATVYAWTRQGRIPCVRPTRSTIRYLMQEVEGALHCHPTRQPTHTSAGAGP